LLLSKLRSFFQLIRAKNLLIVAISQVLLFYKLIYLSTDDGVSDLSIPLFLLLVLSTVIIAASGYVVNDIIDAPIDRINKPKKQIVAKSLSIKNAWFLYWSIVIVGFVISFYVAYQIDNIPLVLIYPAAVLLLYFYSKYFKKNGFLGNLVVSIFCAFVAGIIWFAERQFVAYLTEADPQLGQWVIEVFLAYMIFGFLATLYREIIKDIEDIDGDKALNYKTLPITMGIDRSKFTSQIIGWFLLVLIVLWGIHQIQFYIDQTFPLANISFLILFLITPLVFVIFKTKKAEVKEDYSKISSLLKLLMVSGLIYILII